MKTIIYLLITFFFFLGVWNIFATKVDVTSRTKIINSVIEGKNTNKHKVFASTISESNPENQSEILQSSLFSKENTNEAELITLNFKNADLRNILRMIARSANINIIAGPEVKGSVTMELNKVNWEQALSLVLSVNGFTFLKDGNVIRIVSTEKIQQEPLEISVIPLKYAKANEVIGTIKPMLTPKRGKVESDDRSNIIIINDIPTKISQIEEVIKSIDKPTPQVLIEVNFVEISLGKNDTIGVDWTDMSDYGVLLHDILYTFDKNINESIARNRAHGTESQLAQATRNFSQNKTRTYAYQLSPDNFRLAFSLLANNQRAKIISNPKIQTLDNRKAVIRVAETHYKPTFTYNKETGAYEINNLEDVYVGITLEVTPHINLDGYVILDISPKVSALAGNQVIQGVEVPIVNERMIDARVALKDTYTVAIGGMIKDDWITSRNSIPYLGDLPYVGKTLFSWKKKEKKRDNLVIFITASIVKPEEHLDRWDDLLREMHLKPNGEFADVITNYPAWHKLSVNNQINTENDIIKREKNIIINTATNNFTASNSGN